MKKTTTILDLFEFADGIRWAYVTWLLGDGERRVVAVRDTGWKPLSRDGVPCGAVRP